MAKGKRTIQIMLPEAPVKPVRDVADFHLRWPEFRAEALEIAELKRLTPEQKDILHWLVRLADRIGSRDLL